MDFSEIDNQEFREYLDENEDEFLDVFEKFYSRVRSSIEDEIEKFESGVDASIQPPRTCVFAPIDLVNEELQKGDYRIDRRVSEPEFLAAMNMFIGFRYDNLVDENIYEVFFNFLHDQDDHWLRSLVEYITDREFHDCAGRFFPGYNSLAVNSFISDEVVSNGVPSYIGPLRKFLSSSGRGAKETLVHEMTHAYIFNKSKFNKYNNAIFSVDEAAAQAVSNVLDGNNTPSSKYYSRGNIDQDVMQAARNIFLESVKGKDVQKSISIIRRKAVEGVDKVVDGEDPIRALREESDSRSRIVRVASYATKRMADDVARDLAAIGITRPYTKFADVEQSHERSKELNELWGDLEEINKAGKKLQYLAHDGKVRKNLREPTEKLSENSRKIHDVIRKGYEDDIEGETSFLEDIFGDPDWTDPAIYDEGELLSYMDGILYRYTNLIEEAVSRARKLESATEIVHDEGGKLVQSYENQEAIANAKLIMAETEKLHKELDEVCNNLEEAEEMSKTGLNKIEELREDK